MKVRSWLPTCSSISCKESENDNPPSIPTDLSIQSPTLFSSDGSTSSTSSTSSSLQSNLSLQSLPSIPSLQKEHPSLSNISVLNTSLFSFKPQSSHITCLAVADNLLYAASTNQIHVFDLTNNSHLVTFNDNNSNSGSVKSISFCNGKIITAHQDCKIRVWQITQNNHHHQLVATLPTVKDRLRRFVLPKNYVSVRRHKRRLWIEHVDAVSGVAVGKDLIYSVSWDKCLKIWSSKDLRCLESVKAHEDAVNAVAVSNEGVVYTGSADRRIRVWGKVSGKKHTLIATLEKHKSAVNALALSGDGSVLFSGACDRSILVWEREDSAHYMAVSGALRGHKGAILCLVNVRDVLISGSGDRSVRIWRKCEESSGYSCLSVLEGHEKPVKSLVGVWDGEDVVKVCSGGLDGEIKVWRVEIKNPKCISSSPPLDSQNLKR